MKPVLSKAEEDSASQRQALVCRQTLYTCLEVGLRLLSPVMPFVTEELYQRLPRRRPQTDPPSICITSYPDTEEVTFLCVLLFGWSAPCPSAITFSGICLFLFQFCWHSEDVDRDMDFIMTVVKTIRSLRADYNLTKTRADCKMTHRQIQSNSRRLTVLALVHTVAFY